MRTLPLTPKAGFSFCLALPRCRRGVIAVQTAILLVVLLGFVSIGTDIGAMLWQRRAMQSAANSAAFGAALAATVGNPPSFTLEGKAISASYGFVDGTANTTVNVNHPPTLGTYKNNTGAIEVLITRPYASILASLFYPGAFTIAARAVALTGTGGSACVLALSSSASSAFSASGSVTGNLINCGLDVQSSSASALSLNGSVTLTAEDISIVGGYTTTGSVVIQSTDGIQTHANPVTDPYATLAVPSYGACTQTKYSVSGSTKKTISPGVYCQGLTIKGSSVVTFSPGLYIINGGDFSVTGPPR